MKKAAKRKIDIICEHVSQTMGITLEQMRARSYEHPRESWPRKLCQALLKDICDREITLDEIGIVTSNGNPFDPTTVFQNIQEIRKEMQSDAKKWQMYCNLKSEIETRIQNEVFEIEPKLAEHLRWVRSLAILDEIKKQIDLILKNV